MGIEPLTLGMVAKRFTTELPSHVTKVGNTLTYTELFLKISFALLLNENCFKRVSEVIYQIMLKMKI